jgi:DNA-binding NtrC family response regulator
MTARKKKSKKKETISVLLVDDDPNLQRMVSIFLKKVSIDLDVASNGRLALHKLENNKYNVIISDMQMPQMDGYEFIDNIRQKGLETPIVIISAYAHGEMYDKIFEAGVFDIIHKPFDSNKLISVIERATAMSA